MLHFVWEDYHWKGGAKMYYFIGAQSKKMIFLARFLKELGYEVVCDEKDIVSENEGIFCNKPLSEGMKVIKIELVSKDNELLQQAYQLGLRVYTYQQVINYLISKHETVMVLETNSHFLSVVLATVLDEIRGCNCLIDGNCARAEREKPYFVLDTEIDEAEKLERVTYSVISEEKENLRRYVMNQQRKLNKTKKIVLAYGDNLADKTADLQRPIFFYGLNKKNDIFLRNLEKTKAGYMFDIYLEDTFYGRFDLPIANKKQLVDIMALIAICYYERILAKEVSRSLKKQLPALIESL